LRVFADQFPSAIESDFPAAKNKPLIYQDQGSFKSAHAQWIKLAAIVRKIFA
jgi:hypothetical protein